MIVICCIETVAPCDDAREGGVRARHDEERAKVLHADGCVRDVDGEADGAHYEARKDEWIAHLDAVGPHSEDEEDNGYGKATEGENCGEKYLGRHILAQTYGGTVSS